MEKRKKKTDEQGMKWGSAVEWGEERGVRREDYYR